MVVLQKCLTGSEEDSEEDIEVAMKKQLAELKEKKTETKFTYMVTGVNQIMFMKASVPDHHNLTYRILG